MRTERGISHLPKGKLLIKSLLIHIVRADSLYTLFSSPEPKAPDGL